MTALIARIKNDDIRQMAWVFWWPFVYADLWIRFRKSPRFNSLVDGAWLMGWDGI